MKTEIIGDRNAEDVVVLCIDEKKTQESRERLLEAMAAACKKELPCLLLVSVADWFSDLAPWDADSPYGDETVIGRAEETLRELRDQMEALFPEIGERRIFLCGYSLAGLFALWAGTQTDRFCGIGAVSPSVWYPNWSEYAENTPMKTERVYLSLGKREEKTKNPVMRTVGEAIRREEAVLLAAGIPVILEWNEGNHFYEPEKRVAKAVRWLIRQR